MIAVILEQQKRNEQVALYLRLSHTHSDRSTVWWALLDSHSRVECPRAPRGFFDLSAVVEGTCIAAHDPTPNVRIHPRRVVILTYGAISTGHRTVAWAKRVIMWQLNPFFGRSHFTFFFLQ